ncbi:TIGR04168 family protein [Leptolyngbya sp. FACHB-711]|uniref:TIGR04168 family protein n=1 Tax=unclassified Leptolyngbya TaxID=2650499 RepID=UPI0016865B96|nr:TIGR04168 family protein [Leptolyngbya sp. FACHB-711]MBD2023235.1 TIGR04168 family protein [Leptolyngbya sp. FACHB-711]
MVNGHTPLPAANFSTSTPSTSHALTIAVVGDVHDLWEPADELALKHLGVDLVLLVGDFGNESVEVVRSIAEMSIPKAAVMGNHDAWYTATHWGKKLRTHTEDRVQQQLDLLGATHVGYGKLDFPEFNLSVVGGRPFSWGGSDWSAHGQFYKERYGVQSFEESTAKIVQAVKDAAFDTVLFIGHCGPKGLGAQPEDPCGKDWKPLGGDHGDPDLTAAIEETLLLGKSVPLVTFGHMHHGLRHTKDRLRKMIDVFPTGTVYLNAASVPRIIQTEAGRQRNFSLVQMKAGTITQASLVWLDEEDAIVSEQVLYQAEPASLPTH